MNVRKSADYSAMYRKLTEILARNLPQMDEIHAIGKVISRRPEKGAAEFLQAKFPDRAGFSPRNVRRMRDFYKVYENDEALLRLAMKIGWTLNVVIMEADLTREARRWYLEQAREQQWSKTVLQKAIKNNELSMHESFTVDETETTCTKKEMKKLTTRYSFCIKQIEIAWTMIRKQIYIQYSRMRRRWKQFDLLKLTFFHWLFDKSVINYKKARRM
jgi:predicted nuclease of restriction endonuclease-like (RecB) superfamily